MVVVFARKPLLENFKVRLKIGHCGNVVAILKLFITYISSVTNFTENASDYVHSAFDLGKGCYNFESKIVNPKKRRLSLLIHGFLPFTDLRKRISKENFFFTEFCV